MAARILALVVLFSALGAGSEARADAARRRPDSWTVPDLPRQPAWDAAWSHSNAWDYSLAAVGTGAILFEEIVLQPIRPPMRWNGPILFDADVRRALRSSRRPGPGRGGGRGPGSPLGTPARGIRCLVDMCPSPGLDTGTWLAEDLFWQDAVTLVRSRARWTSGCATWPRAPGRGPTTASPRAAATASAPSRSDRLLPRRPHRQQHRGPACSLAPSTSTQLYGGPLGRGHLCRHDRGVQPRHRGAP